jgi:hypothetical protein
MNLDRREGKHGTGGGVVILLLIDRTWKGWTDWCLDVNVEHPDPQSLAGTDPPPSLAPVVPDDSCAAADIDTEKLTLNNLEVCVALADAWVI